MLKLGVQLVLSVTDAPNQTASEGLGSISEHQAPQPQAHRGHWEYLSYLFRKIEMPENEQPAELAYRDFLQVRQISVCLCSLLDHGLQQLLL